MVLIGSIFMYGCKKQNHFLENNYSYQDSLLFELEYNSLDMDTNTVDFDTNGFTNQL